MMLSSAGVLQRSERCRFELMKNLTTLQQTVIKLLQQSISLDGDLCPNYSTLLSSSSAARAGAVGALAQEFQRMAQKCANSVAGYSSSTGMRRWSQYSDKKLITSGRSYGKGMRSWSNRQACITTPLTRQNQYRGRESGSLRGRGNFRPQVVSAESPRAGMNV